MIENQDCLEYLNNIESESVDLVLTDPPYFIGFDGGKGSEIDKVYYEKSLIRIGEAVHW